MRRAPRRTRECDALRSAFFGTHDPPGPGLPAAAAAGHNLGAAIVEQLFAKLDDEARNADPEVLEQKALLDARLKGTAAGGPKPPAQRNGAPPRSSDAGASDDEAGAAPLE